MFDSKSLRVLEIIFKFITYFNFLYNMYKGSHFCFSASGCLVVVAQFAERLYVLNCYSILLKNQFTIMYGLYLGFQFYSIDLCVCPHASPAKSKLI